MLSIPLLSHLWLLGGHRRDGFRIFGAGVSSSSSTPCATRPAAAVMLTSSFCSPCASVFTRGVSLECTRELGSHVRWPDSFLIVFELFPSGYQLCGQCYCNAYYYRSSCSSPSFVMMAYFLLFSYVGETFSVSSVDDFRSMFSSVFKFLSPEIWGCFYCKS